MPKKPTVGAVVRARREELGLSLEQLAVYADTGSRTLSNLELYDRVPKHTIMRRLAEQLDMDVLDLYRAAIPAEQAS